MAMIATRWPLFFNQLIKSDPFGHWSFVFHQKRHLAAHPYHQLDPSPTPIFILIFKAEFLFFSFL
jgi:hypothetical protein